MLKSYHFLNRYKHWNPRITAPPADGVAFYHKVTKNNNYHNNNNLQKNVICHECCKKGQMKFNCPNTNIDRDYDEESTNKDKNKAYEKTSKTTKENHNKFIQFVQDTDNEASDDDDHTFVPFFIKYCRPT